MGDEYFEKLLKRVREEQVLPDKALGVKYARLMQLDGHPVKVLACLWEDGAITSCAFDSRRSVECCHSETDGGQGAYFAWIAHLAAMGYKEMPIEVE
jgi:hypothetical protein